MHAATPPSLIAHGAAVIATATVLAVGYTAASAYLAGNVDPKLGPAGMLQLATLVIVLCSGLATMGSSLYHLFGGSRAQDLAPRRLVLHGVVVGAAIAALHWLVLAHMPVLPGISDWPQYCVYFLVLGCALHWLVARMAALLSRHVSPRGDGLPRH